MKSFLVSIAYIVLYTSIICLWRDVKACGLSERARQWLAATALCAACWIIAFKELWP
jgi:hypothetical protein